MMMDKQNGAASRLDRLAIRLTGGQVHTGFTGPHMIILANGLFLLAGLAGMIAVIMGLDMSALIVAAMLGTTFHKVAVEWKERGYAPKDEREDALHWKALAIGVSIPLTLLVVWMLLLGAFADDGMWHPVGQDDWTAVATFALGLAGQLASIVKARMTPSYAADLLDDE
jgi:hypothetical protein